MTSEKNKNKTEKKEEIKSRIVEFHGKKIDSRKLDKKVTSKSNNCICMIVCLLAIFIVAVLLYLFFR